MSAALTYHVRAGQLSALAAGRVFQVPTHQDPTRILTWEKPQELKAGKYTLWDHCFEATGQPLPGPPLLPGGAGAGSVIHRLNLTGTSSSAGKLEVYDWPGEFAQRFDGPAVPHRHPGPAVRVGDRRAGLYIHGSPVCNLKQCVVVLRQWDELIRAIASEAELSFAVVF